MEGVDIFIMIFSMMLSALLGGFGMLLFGGKTAMNYLIVKASRGRKILVFARTAYGWRTFVAKKKQNTLTWKYDKQKLTTSLEHDGDITRYLRLDAVFVDADRPARVITLKKGDFYPSDFDPETFNNILIRAITRPNVDGEDTIRKMLVGVLILLILVGFGVLMIYVKVSEAVPVLATVV